MRFYFNGCSITQGAGFANEKLNPNIYPNLIATDYINDASGGASNLKIFLQVLFQYQKFLELHLVNYAYVQVVNIMT